MNALTKTFTDAVEAQFKTLSADVKEALDKAGTMTSIVQDLEQKMARTGGGLLGFEEKSWGEQFAESDGLKSFADDRSGPARFRMDVKTVTSLSTSGGSLVPAHRDGIVMQPQRRLRVRDLLNSIKVTSGSVEYPRQTTRTLNADIAPENTVKPESDLAWELANVPIRTIAHWIPASVQILDDAPQLAGLIDSELRYGLQLKEDAQLLNGSGSGNNLQGMNAIATAFAKPAGTAVAQPTSIDQIALGLLQVMLADFVPDGIILHPADLLNMMLTKDAGGGYILKWPSDAAGVLNLWGVPVATTTAQNVGKFTLGQFSTVTLYDRWEPRIDVSTEHADFFTRNMVAIRAEERLGLATKQPKAIVYGNTAPA